MAHIGQPLAIQLVLEIFACKNPQNVFKWLSEKNSTIAE